MFVNPSDQLRGGQGAEQLPGGLALERAHVFLCRATLGLAASDVGVRMPGSGSCPASDAIAASDRPGRAADPAMSTLAVRDRSGARARPRMSIQFGCEAGERGHVASAIPAC